MDSTVNMEFENKCLDTVKQAVLEYSEGIYGNNYTMEKSLKTLEYKIEQYKNAVNDFKTSLEIDISVFEPSVADTLKSGQVQKFEVCAELMWKTIRIFLLEVNGVECKSPKQAVKKFYNLSYVSTQEYEAELDVLDDRNSLSHIYNKAQFEVLYTRVHKTLPVFRKVLNEIQTLYLG